jgi:hypothetical protein
VTIDAARALGLEREIGSLEAGKKADIILVDLFKPHLMPLNMPVYRVTSFANGADVSTTIVNGRILMEDGKVLTVDQTAVMERAQAATDLMLERTGSHCSNRRRGSGRRRITIRRAAQRTGEPLSPGERPRVHRGRLLDAERVPALQADASLIVPRPIALVTTQNATGVVNAAPFSMFNMMGEDPPILMISINKLRTGTSATAANILAHGQFVVHIADEPMAEQMHRCGDNLPAPRASSSPSD